MLFEGIVLGLIIGFICKGKIRNFEYLSMTWWQLIVVALLIQKLSMNLSISDGLFYVLHLLSYGIIMLVCILNYKVPSIFIIMLGNLMNAIVIAVNNGAMPVQLPMGFSEVFDRGHVLLSEGSHLAFLGDIFYIDVFYYAPRMLSLGDFVLLVGTFVFVLNGMFAKPREDGVLR